MRVLVSGANGLLGTEVCRELTARGHESVATTRAELDIANPESAAQIAAKSFGEIDWIINCAAYTAVDKAEEEEREATFVNGFGVGYLGQASAMAKVKLLHISTDFVFDGAASAPYTEDAPTNPLGAYGRSKLIGEKALFANPLSLVVRTSWLFGPHGACFPRTMLRAHKEGRKLRVVSDQIGTPTYTPDLARVMVDLIDLNPFPGIYHAAGPDVTNWYEFAKLVIETCTGSPAEIEPIKTEDWPTPAKRPRYSALSFEKVAALGIKPMRPLWAAVEDFCGRVSDGS